MLIKNKTQGLFQVISHWEIFFFLHYDYVFAVSVKQFLFIVTFILSYLYSFTQRDINEGRVWYVHSNNHLTSEPRTIPSSPVSDQLLFSVADSSHPPNILANQSFIVQVEPSPAQVEVAPLQGAQLGIMVS